MSFWSRQSIAVKLPLAFAFVLLILGTAMGVVSYLEVRQTVVNIASQRLEQAATQMATVLGTSGRQRIAAMQQLMQRADIIDFLRTRNAAHAASIEASILKYLGTATAIANVEVWDPSGHRLLAAGAPIDDADDPSHAGYVKELASTAAIIGPLRDAGDGLLYPVGGRVAANGETLGYVIERRRISNPAQTQQTINLLSGLIGSAATIVVGNNDGSAWTDLSTSVSGVPITPDASDRLLEYERAGMPRVFAWARPIDATPWIVAIEFPRAVVLAPADRLGRRVSALAVTLLLIAAVIGWAISMRITTPLRRVTEAAEEVAEGRHVAAIDIDRHDEIGRLADSFNTMTERVEHARHELEGRVESRTAELSAVNRELESFSYSVSHDLRAPLRAIVGFVQILEEDHGKSLDAEARRALDRVKVNATRMGQLIDDLLAFAQITRVPLSRQRVDLTHLARTTADEAIATATHPIELAIEPLPPCTGEPVLLKQVFANLISNAIKFTAKTERARVEIGATTNGETIYYVRDNGAGFDERFAEKLFGVFQRLHRTVEFEGTGVGLAIVQRIITRHGGRVWAEGKINHGATFYFTLPSAPVTDSGKHRVAAHQ
jgi:signal transduction histidine kinase